KTRAPYGSAATTVSAKPWARQTFTQTLTVPTAKLWSPDTPHLYRAAVQLGKYDAVDVTFGIRTLKWDADKGFFLNGERVELKGTCNHQDHAGVGAALPDALQDFRVKKLKEMGCNAYRTSHNPPTPELLDACDRLGMLVMDETRMMSSNDEGLSQLERLILRDRNHPSVFIWSIGNEEPEQGTNRGAKVAATMKRKARELDPTRLVTEAMNGQWGKGLSPIVDVQGFNYRYQGIDEYHKQFPKQFTTGTEFASTVSTRGIYENDTVKGYVSSYDRNYPPWASTAEGWWSYFAEREYLSGGFVWTGFDYRGEPTPYGWPCISSHFGIMDMCGFPKDLFYYYKSWWGPERESVLHLFPHWNWEGKEGQDVEVWCFTNCETVELFVNGVTQGWQKVAKNSHASWNVRYQPGVLEVRGQHHARAGTLIDRRETTGAPAQLVLRPDRTSLVANGEDTIVVACEVQDAEGRVVPTAMNNVQFAVTGPGRIIGVGNGDPSSHEPDRATKRNAFNGLCMALVQSTRAAGTVTVTASAPGLKNATFTVMTSGTPRATLA
ncbi:MAG: glycoside hydrolase family 2 TIM barrel-domain containing protein, partial [Acidobacteriota bacterium]